MICYKDTTFCCAPCSTESCPHKLTAKAHEDAKKWWGNASGDAPIAISDYSDTCPEFKPIKENNEKI